MQNPDTLEYNKLELLGKILDRLTSITEHLNREGTSQPRYLMNSQQAAQHLGVRNETMATWRHRGTGPNYIKVGSTVRYRKNDLEDFLRQREVTR